MRAHQRTRPELSVQGRSPSGRCRRDGAWTILPGPGIGCLSRTLEPVGVKQIASADITFADGELPRAGGKLATYATPANRVFATIVTSQDRCKTTSGTNDGQRATATIGAMSFPHYGDQSAAFAVSLHVQGITAGEDVLG